MFRPPPRSTLFPYTTLFRSGPVGWRYGARRSTVQPVGVRRYRSRSWSRFARPCQNSTVSGTTRTPPQCSGGGTGVDRKSTRLNSSHPSISYAVFCLKKKTTYIPPFYFNVPAPPAIYTLSLHDALPIWTGRVALRGEAFDRPAGGRAPVPEPVVEPVRPPLPELDRLRYDPHTTPVLGRRHRRRSEEHTSELQSPVHLVCRLLLEKKNNIYSSFLF